MSVPAEPARPIKFLPLFQSVTDGVVGIATGEAEKEGLTVSCSKGCGACCRQLVPISVTEARRLHQLIQEMPEPRKSEIRRRFAAGRERVECTGLLEELKEPERISKGEARTLGYPRSEEHTSELQSLTNIVCRLLLGKKKKKRLHQ